MDIDFSSINKHLDGVSFKDTGRGDLDIIVTHAIGGFWLNYKIRKREYRKFMRLPLSDMPLYLNYKHVSSLFGANLLPSWKATLARYRIKIGI